MDLDVTSPLRLVKDIKLSFKKIFEKIQIYYLVSMN